MFEVERELQRDDRAAEGAGRGHLVQARHLAELALERRGDRRRHHVRARARIERQHLDGRVVDLRQRRDRQLAVGDDAGQQDRRHQQRGRDRPQDERARRIHGPSRAPVPAVDPDHDARPARPRSTTRCRRPP